MFVRHYKHHFLSNLLVLSMPLVFILWQYHTLHEIQSCITCFPGSQKLAFCLSFPLVVILRVQKLISVESHVDGKPCLAHLIVLVVDSQLYGIWEGSVDVVLSKLKVDRNSNVSSWYVGSWIVKKVSHQSKEINHRTFSVRLTCFKTSQSMYQLA